MSRFTDEIALFPVEESPENMVFGRCAEDLRQ